jgi:hypothetical protein
MTSILRTIQQTETPLNLAFFSELNMNRIQRRIRQTFKDQTGISIDYQKHEDVLILMRMVYINNSSDPWTKSVGQQLQTMNDTVVKIAVGQIGSGVNQYINYIRDISQPIQVNPLPVSTTSYGTAMRDHWPTS